MDNVSWITTAAGTETEKRHKDNPYQSSVFHFQSNFFLLCTRIRTWGLVRRYRWSLDGSYLFPPNSGCSLRQQKIANIIKTLTNIDGLHSIKILSRFISRFLLPFTCIFFKRWKIHLKKLEPHCNWSFWSFQHAEKIFGWQILHTKKRIEVWTFNMFFYTNSRRKEKHSKHVP